MRQEIMTAFLRISRAERRFERQANAANCNAIATENWDLYALLMDYAQIVNTAAIDAALQAVDIERNQ